MLKNKGKITTKDVMDVLRNHNLTPEKEQNWSPDKTKSNSPCRHAANITVPDQTTGSSVSHLMKDIQIHWVTGSSTPCISTFKPIFLPKPGLKTKFKISEGTYNQEGFWWINEKFQRLVLQDYQNRLAVFKDERDALEKGFFKKTEEIIKSVSSEVSDKELKIMEKVSNDAFDESIKKVLEWTSKIEKMPIQRKNGFIYRLYWNKQNKQAKLKL